MSPTSYQTAPPRTLIINNAFDIVKPPAPLRRFSGALPLRETLSDLRRSAGLRILSPRRPPHPTPDSPHRTDADLLSPAIRVNYESKDCCAASRTYLWARKTSARK